MTTALPAAFTELIAALGSEVAAARGDPVRVRAVWERFAEGAPVAEDIALEAVEIEGVRGEWSRTAARSDRAVLHLHGGAYTLCSARTHRYLCGELARAVGADVFALDYRLAPEHPFPAALDDAVAAWRWLLARGLPAQRLAVSGDSAGGGLALALMLRLRELRLPLPAAAFVIAPWTDLTLSGESVHSRTLPGDLPLDPRGLSLSAAAYAGGADLRHGLISALFADTRGLPPVLIHVSSVERLLDDSLRMAARLAHDGVAVQLDVWPDQPHIWHGYSWLLPSGRTAIAQAGTWLRSRFDAAPG